MDFLVCRHTSPVAACAAGSVVAIGNFDGLHRGHRAVIAEARKKADALALPLVVVTFEPHPKKVIRPEAAPWRLTPFAAKARKMHALGVNVVYALRFTRAYAATTPERFIEETLRATLKARHIFVGYDFAFGRGRGGSAETLKETGAEKGMDVTVVPAVEEGAAPISSTRVRAALEAGNTALAETLLGEKFTLRLPLTETEMLSLAGRPPRDFSLKKGAYWAEVSYNGQRLVQPVMVKGTGLFIPPVGTRVEGARGMAEIAFMEEMNQLKAAAP